MLQRQKRKNLTTKSKHGGNFREYLERAHALGWDGSEQEFIDASANLNPLGPPPWINEVMFSSLELLTHYPDPAYMRLSAAAASCFGISAARIVFGNGADEIMFALARALAKKTAKSQKATIALVAVPSYSSYREALSLAGFSVKEFPYKTLLNNFESEPDMRRSATCWIGAPNNPDGAMPPCYPQCIIKLAKDFPETNFIIDEAFIEFTNYTSLCELKSLPDNIFIIRSLTKIFAVPGLRIGYVVVPESYAHLLREEIPNWPLNTVAEHFALEAFSRPEVQSYIAASKAFIHKEKQYICHALAPYYELSEAQANFYCITFSPHYFTTSNKVDASTANHSNCDVPALTTNELTASLEEFLFKNGIAVRNVSNYSNITPWIFRIAIRTHKENNSIISALTAFAELYKNTSSALCCIHNSKIKTVPAAISSDSYKLQNTALRRANAVMIQGCSSSAGKSIITSALCRILRNYGFDVAPYKAQNMSNNSAVTRDGFEIGRAQAVQAMACGLEPDPRMNPVLIKPEGNMESQVIVMGKPWKRNSARDYYKQKKELASIAQEAYDSLAGEHEVIVLEGAGSPAEINLKSHDFVNMEAAIHADADVYLVGDIDRGGVFASFLGHVATFSHQERSLLKGFIINKFRGDITLLTPAYELLAKYTSVPVLGCVPYFRDIVIPEEDESKLVSLWPHSIETEQHTQPCVNEHAITLGIIMFPHVSNFTDFEPFAFEPYVCIKKIFCPADSRGTDAIILPGSKTTIKDYLWLKETGLARVVQERAAEGTIIIGICGGLQMLGTEIHDPDHIESEHTVTKSLALLPLITTFSPNKQLARGMYTIAKPDILLKNETSLAIQNFEHIQQVFLTLSQWEISGYEIHHGVTKCSEINLHSQADTSHVDTSSSSQKPIPFIFNSSGNPVAWYYKNIIGTYLHGIFENDELRTALINCIRTQKNLQEQSIYLSHTTDAELEKLSNFIASYIDIDTILKNLMKQTNRKTYRGWS